MSQTTYISMTFEIPQDNTVLILPLSSFSGIIDWGNGTTLDYLSITNNPSVTYSLTGTYNVRLMNVINCSSFVNRTSSFQNYLTDFSYLIKIPSLTNLRQLFFNCSRNFTINFEPNVTDNVTNMSSMFSQTPLFNQPINLDCSSCETLQEFLFGATQFNSPLNLTNTQKCTIMQSMFQQASAFNKPINLDCSECIEMNNFLASASSFNNSLNLMNTGKVKSMRTMFSRASSFNQPINLDCSSCESFEGFLARASTFNSSLNLINTISLRRTDYMFQSCASFNQPVIITPIPLLQNTNEMFKNVPNLSTTNYSNLLILWGGQTVRPNVTLNAPMQKYNNQALPYRNILTSAPNNWNIQDGGLAQQTTTVIDVPSTQTKTYGDAPFNLTYTSNNPSTPTYSSSQTNVATINQSGLVTILSPGQTTLTISLPETSDYTSGSATCILTVETNSPSYPVNIATTYGVEYFLSTENATYGEISVPTLQVTNLINSTSSSKQLTSNLKCVLFI